MEGSEADLPQLSTQVRKLADEIVITDLNWARITPWRELTAQFFDSSEARAYLELLSEVRIEYDRALPAVAERRVRLLFLAAWLASRLGWEPESHVGNAGDEKRLFRFRSKNGQVEVVITPREYPAGGPAAQITLVSKSSQGAASFSMASALGRQSLVTRVELPGRSLLERTVRLPVPDEVELLNEELKLANRDRVYEDTLNLLERMTTS